MGEQRGSVVCDCYRCGRIENRTVAVGPVRLPVHLTRMILCPVCGNKRCPKATDHWNDCTGSNETGQAGSRYGGIGKEAKSDA